MFRWVPHIVMMRVMGSRRLRFDDWSLVGVSVGNHRGIVGVHLGICGRIILSVESCGRGGGRRNFVARISWQGLCSCQLFQLKTRWRVLECREGHLSHLAMNLRMTVGQGPRNGSLILVDRDPHTGLLEVRGLELGVAHLR